MLAAELLLQPHMLADITEDGGKASGLGTVAAQLIASASFDAETYKVFCPAAQGDATVIFLPDALLPGRPFQRGPTDTVTGKAGLGEEGIVDFE